MMTGRPECSVLGGWEIPRLHHAEHRGCWRASARPRHGRYSSPSCTIWSMSEMPISDAREHLGEVVGRARYGGQETILTDYGAPAAVVISFKEYQRLKHARDDAGEYQLPPESWPRSARAVRTPGAASRA